MLFKRVVEDWNLVWEWEEINEDVETVEENNSEDVSDNIAEENLDLVDENPEGWNDIPEVEQIS